MKLNQVLLAKAAGFERLEPVVIGRLEQYADLLIQANQKINLISRSRDLPAEIERQLTLSLALMRCCDAPPRSWVDIGSGGGFPVVPLAIAWGETKFTAVEPIAKKAYFIERTVQELGLQNLTVEPSRIEDVIVMADRKPWDVVSIIAVADWKQTFIWSATLLVRDGKLMTYKPEDISLDESELASKYGFEVMRSLNLKELIDIIDLRIVVCKKV